jgi:hypothetical protein
MLQWEDYFFSPYFDTLLHPQRDGLFLICFKGRENRIYEKKSALDFFFYMFMITHMRKKYKAVIWANKLVNIAGNEDGGMGNHKNGGQGNVLC